MSTGLVSNEAYDLTAILNRVAEVAYATTDEGIADALGCGRSTLSTWRRRGTIPWDLLGPFADRRGLNWDWLISGRAPMLRSELSARENRPAYQVDSALLRAVIEAAVTVFEEERLQLPPAKFAELCALAYELELAATGERNPRARVVQLMRLAA